MQTFLITIIGAFIGAFGGAFAQYWFGMRKTRNDLVQDAKSQSYADFLKAVAQITSAQRVGDKEAERNGLMSLTEAKARLCIWANPEVIASAAKLERTGAKLDNPSSIKAFIRMIQAMRDRIYSGGKASENDLYLVLFGENLKNE